MSERELLFKVTKDDFTEIHIRGSGPGGQHRNKTSTGVRLVHKDSGAVGEATDSKSQADNRTNAFRKLIETTEWKSWFRDMVNIHYHRPTLDQLIKEAMDEKNIRTQIRENDKWVDVDGEIK